MKNNKIFFLGHLYLMAILLIIVGCSSNKSDVSDKLEGKWSRSDGNYTIDIKKVQRKGKLIVAYYNPNQINVGRAGWREQENKLQVYIELRDENYPGSIYQLSYDDKAEMLKGTYYQAATRQTYNIYFIKTNQ